MMYWLGSPKPREAIQPVAASKPAFEATNGAAHSPHAEPALAGK